MAAVVKLSPRSRAGTYLTLPGTVVNVCTFPKHNLYVEIGPGSIDVVSDTAKSPKDGYKAPPEGTILKGQSVEIKLIHPIRVSVYNAMIEVNPWLYTVGRVQWKRLLHPDEGPDFKVYLSANKDFSLKELPGGWLVQVTLIN